ncbi:MAG: hypothetical protein ACJ748_01910 [Flavisolibacter sp.]
MKKLLAIILLISHINFAMFIAQVDEVDAFDKTGQQSEDVNSLVQYLAQICHIKHKPLKDSDDDNARFFHIEKLDYSISGLQFELIPKPELSEKIIYPPLLQNKPSSIYLDISSPPPRIV